MEQLLQDVHVYRLTHDAEYFELQRSAQHVLIRAAGQQDAAHARVAQSNDLDGGQTIGPLRVHIDDRRMNPRAGDDAHKIAGLLGHQEVDTARLEEVANRLRPSPVRSTDQDVHLIEL